MWVRQTFRHVLCRPVTQDKPTIPRFAARFRALFPPAVGHIVLAQVIRVEIFTSLGSLLWDDWSQGKRGALGKLFYDVQEHRCIMRNQGQHARAGGLSQHGYGLNPSNGLKEQPIKK